ncbi:hypothetical protein GCM10009122_35010 [Fulvivirga kasyanovii]|uniref:Uncharacterized protein n=1 Tax=Fulvivirga kasyanovii TaxID=396812 RepID=A0ABW9RMK0_9BACT|nr:hypothetical protein [Fulvivirga kasyanovii]MTI24589.1 hypothetical protein [Fulvivirga kasyanovii]
MKGYQKFGLIATQILFGSGFGILGFITFAVLATISFELFGMYLELSASIFYSIIGGYIGMLVGVCYTGYKFLKSKNRNTEFFRHFLQCLLGLILGLGVFLFVAVYGSRFTNMTTNFLASTLPLVGAITCFNIGLTKQEKK